MKHTPHVTLLLIGMFALAQIIGILVANAYFDGATAAVTGEPAWRELPSFAGMKLERPDVSPLGGLLYIAGAIGIGTMLVLLLMRFAFGWVWKVWFFSAVAICLFIAFAAIVSQGIALFLATLLALWKILRPNIIIHNLTELFMYGGLAALFAPMLSLAVAFALLVFLSLYDMYAVWRSKHMIKMAKFQASTGIFAGILLPYHLKKGIRALRSKKRQRSAKRLSSRGQWRTAVLGGGDIGFPLIFSAVVLAENSLLAAMLIVPFTTAALAALFFGAKKNRFYPAMPFLSVGCLAGYAFIWMIGLL